MQMRHLVNLVEAAGQPDYFFHVSAKKNLASIRQKGLIANMPGESPEGNYDGEWESLTGTYMTDDAALIAHMIENRDDLSKFIICLIEVADCSTLLPDEDIINTVLAEAYRRMGEPDFDYNDDMNNEGTIRVLAKALAAAGSMPVSDQARMVARQWLLVRENGDEAAETHWGTLKDEFVRAHPRLKRSTDHKPHSVRFPDSIGFQGDPRIVAILGVGRETMNTVAGAVPAGALPKVQILANALGLDWGKKPQKQATKTDVAAKRALTLEVALKCFPGRPKAEMQRIISQMDEAQLDENITRMREVLARQPAPPP